MIGYLFKRFLLALLSIWIISILAFVIIQLPPGDAVDKYIERLREQGDAISLNQAEVLREELGLDSPFIARYGKWIWKIAVHQDPGYSYLRRGMSQSAQRPVLEIVGDRLVLTIILSSFTISVTWIFAIPIGIYSAVRQHSIGDYVFTFLGFTGLAVPDFLLGLVLMYLAFAYLDQSVGGLFSAEYEAAAWSLEKIYDLLKHLWIPAVVLGTAGTASLIRIMRNNLLDELGKPYVVTARSKGIGSWRLILKYPVRVAINPLISTIGYLLPALIGGSVIVSVVLSLPTLGPVLLESMMEEDVYTAGFVILLLGVLTVVGTLISDLLLAVVDPRIKLTR